MPNAAPDLECQIFSSFSDIEAERARWDEFAAFHGAPIYMSFDWCRLWWEFYGGRRRLAIFRVLADKELVGLLPIFIDDIGLGPFGITLARLVGAADGPSRVFDPPLRPDVAARVVHTVVDTLIGGRMCDAVILGPVSFGYAGVTDPAPLFDGEPYRIQTRLIGPLTFFDLSDQPEDYLATLPGSEQRRRKHDLRNLARHGAKETMIVGPGPEIETEFREMARLHTGDWDAKGRLGHFRAWPKAGEYHLALAKCLSGLDRLRLLKIEADQETVLYDYIYAFGRSYFGELRARSLDRKWSKISLGSCALVFMLRHAVREGMTCLYVGVGHNEYEARLGAAERPAVTIMVSPKRWPARVRVAAFSLVYALVELLYFKIWYMRIQPRLPKFFRRPIWKFWSRISI